MGRNHNAILIVALVVQGLTPRASAAQLVVEGHVRNGGSAVQNAAVYLVPLDPVDGVSPDERATIDQRHLSFTPTVMVVAPGTELSFLNSDDVLHNVFGPSDGDWEGFDLGTYDQGEQRSRVFDRPGLNVVLCHVHPEMAMFVIVASTKYRALSVSDGSFTIEGVPPGRYRLHAWHPRHWRNEFTSEITVAGDVSDVTITLGRRNTPGQPQR